MRMQRNGGGTATEETTRNNHERRRAGLAILQKTQPRYVLMAAPLFDAASIFSTPSHRYALIRRDASAAAECVSQSAISEELRLY